MNIADNELRCVYPFAANIILILFRLLYNNKLLFGNRQ